MYHIYQSTEHGLETVQELAPGAWIDVVDPSEDEVATLLTLLGADEDLFRAALDENEAARFETEDDQTLVIVDVPVKELGPTSYYETVPLGVLLLEQAIVTISLRDTEILRPFEEGRVKGHRTAFKTRFVLQILYAISSRYLLDLRILEKITQAVEQKMMRSQRNEDLIDMLKVEKSLVYFRTSLRSNQRVLDRLLRSAKIKSYSEDEDLLEDVIIENRQAIEMADLYFSILSSTMDAYASMISNNQNDVMKILTVATMIMAIPTIISGLFGMNLAVPLDEYGDISFWLVTGLTVVIAIIAAWLLKKLRMY